MSLFVVDRFDFFRCKEWSIVNFKLRLTFISKSNFKQGRQAHHTYLTQRSYGMMGEG